MKNILSHRYIKNSYDRVFFMAIISLIINLAFGFYNLYLGVSHNSMWFKCICAYYLLLGILRFICVLGERKAVRKTLISKSVGALLFILGIILCFINFVSLSSNIAISYGTIPMITIATYTFYKITLAVIRAINIKKSSSAIFKAISVIGFSELSVSVVSMQRSMIVSFGNMDNYDALIMNTFTGTAAFIFIVAMGIILLKGERNG